jgi:hypothetical protein
MEAMPATGCNAGCGRSSISILAHPGDRDRDAPPERTPRAGPSPGRAVPGLGRPRASLAVCVPRRNPSRSQSLTPDGGVIRDEWAGLGKPRPVFGRARKRERELLANRRLRLPKTGPSADNTPSRRRRKKAERRLSSASFEFGLALGSSRARTRFESGSASARAQTRSSSARSQLAPARPGAHPWRREPEPPVRDRPRRRHPFLGNLESCPTACHSFSAPSPASWPPS